MSYPIGAIVCSDHDEAVEGSQNAPEVDPRLIPLLWLTLQNKVTILDGVTFVFSKALISSMDWMLRLR